MVRKELTQTGKLGTRNYPVILLTVATGYAFDNTSSFLTALFSWMELPSTNSSLSL